MSTDRLRWHKSSYSGGDGGDCVEVAETPDAVLVRDTQHRDLGHVGFDPKAWAVFISDVKHGRL